jgi:hypothetical protein
MKILNIHHRLIQQPKFEIAKLFGTLSSDNDLMLATNKWPRMRLDKGLVVGSKGGHGPIRYFVKEYQEGEFIKFQFDMPGFDGFHQFEIKEVENNQTNLTHIIDLTTSGMATIKWVFAIRWLHDAFIEDAFDRVENHFLKEKKHTKWNLWVVILRNIMKRK